MKRLFFALLAGIMLASSLSFMTSLVHSVPPRRAFLWWQKDFEISVDDATLLSWAKSFGFTDLAVYGSLEVSDINYFKSGGLHVFNIAVAPQSLTNYTQWTSDFAAYLSSVGYDGGVVDDTQNVWYMAQNNGLDDLVTYQQFMNNVTNNLVSVFGADNVIVEIAGWGDSTDYAEMTQVNATCTFSYYYPPIANLKYYSAYANTSLNAWDMVDYYNSRGLHSYYKYQGWLWFENPYNTAHLSTLSMINSFNGIIDLFDSYTGNDLMIYSFARIYQNDRIEPFLKEIITNFKADLKLTTDKLTLENFSSYYWVENFSTTPTSESYLSSDTWKITKAAANYSYTYVSPSSMDINFSGTNTGFQGITFERLLPSSELGLIATIQFTPYSNQSWKQFILKAIYPYPYAFIVSFDYGASQLITLHYRNETWQDKQLNLGNWTSGASYDVTFYLNETSAYISINGNVTLINPVTQYYSSQEMYSFFYSDFTGTWATPNSFRSANINLIQILPMRNKIDILEWDENQYIEGEPYTSIEVYFCVRNFPSTDSNMNLSVAAPNCIKFQTQPNVIFHIGFQSILDQYFMFGIGVTGLLFVVFAPCWCIWEVKKHGVTEEAIERFGYAMLLFIVGFGLIVMYLWS